MSYLRDLAERTLATYVQAFVGLLVAGWSGALDLGTLRAAAVAAIPAALAVVKGGLARLVGDPQSASLVGQPVEACPGASWEGWPQ